MLEDTKGIIRNCHSRQDRLYNDEMLEDTKGITRSRHSKRDRQYNDEMLEDTKGITRSVIRSRTDNAMIKCWQIPKR
jgi:hypothetical protein